eukprot:scaffold64240_cov27-Phaeocystis_antarctica.AAC.2
MGRTGAWVHGGVRTSAMALQMESTSRRGDDCDETVMPAKGNRDSGERGAGAQGECASARPLPHLLETRPVCPWCLGR